jgi:hypothetical protein
MTALTPIDLGEAEVTVAVANTPIFLARRLRENPAVRRALSTHGAERIFVALQAVSLNKPATLAGVTEVYFYLIALSLDDDGTWLRRALALPAPHDSCKNTKSASHSECALLYQFLSECYGLRGIDQILSNVTEPSDVPHKVSRRKCLRDRARARRRGTHRLRRHAVTVTRVNAHRAVLDRKSNDQSNKLTGTTPRWSRPFLRHRLTGVTVTRQRDKAVRLAHAAHSSARSACPADNGSAGDRDARPPRP